MSVRDLFRKANKGNGGGIPTGGIPIVGQKPERRVVVELALVGESVEIGMHPGFNLATVRMVLHEGYTKIGNVLMAQEIMNHISMANQKPKEDHQQKGADGHASEAREEVKERGKEEVRLHDEQKGA